MSMLKPAWAHSELTPYQLGVVYKDIVTMPEPELIRQVEASTVLDLLNDPPRIKELKDSFLQECKEIRANR